MASPRQIANDLRATAALRMGADWGATQKTLLRGAHALDEALHRLAEAEAEAGRLCRKVERLEDEVLNLKAIEKAYAEAYGVELQVGDLLERARRGRP